VADKRHLLVDGSNIVRDWPELRELHRRDRAAAHAQLEGSLARLHDHEGVRVTLVFDGSGSDLDVRCPGGQRTFAVVRTPSGTTADDFIEGWIGRASAPAACVVATGDVAEGRTVVGLGAEWISPDELASWVKRAATSLDAGLAQRRRENARSWAGRP